MTLISCSENCKYQNNGYCDLLRPTKINDPRKMCPYYQNREDSSTDQFERGPQRGNGQ